MSEMKWPLAGYAPGRYTCVCQVCGDQFEGDKRAYQCLACATKSIVNSHASLVEENARLREALNATTNMLEMTTGGQLCFNQIKHNRELVPAVKPSSAWPKSEALK